MEKAVIWKVTPTTLVILGSVVMVGWWLHIPSLIQIHSSFVPMQFNTALCFVGCGVALLLLESAPGKVKPIAVVVSMFGLLTLLEYGLNVDLRIDQFFVNHSIITKTSHPGRMAPNTALCFLLAGCALMNRSRVRQMIVVFILTLGAAAFSGYVTGIEQGYGWGSLTSMAIHTSVGFLVFGGYLFYFESQKEKPWLPGLVIGTLMVLCSIGLWLTLAASERRKLNLEIVRLSDLIAFEIRRIINDQVAELERMSRRISSGLESPEAWVIDAESHLNDISALLALARTLPDGGHEFVTQGVVDIPQAAWSRKMDDDTFQFYFIERPRLVYQVGPHLRALFAPGKWFEMVEFDKLQIHVLTPDGISIHGNPMQDQQVRDVRPIKIGTIEWEMQVVPKPAMVDGSRSTIPEIAFLAALMFSFLLPWALAKRFALKRLTDQLNGQVKQKTLEVVEQSEFARTVFDSMPSHIVVLDANGRIELVNQQWLDFAVENGLDPASVGPGIDYFGLGSSLEDEMTAHLTGLREIMKGQREGFDYEYPCHSSTENRWFLMRAVPLKRGGKLIGVVIAHIDITLRVLAEKRRDSVLAELRQANAELAQFAFIASHDLQEPLRKIRSFVSLLSESLSEEKSSEIHYFISRVRSNAERISQLVEDLLQLHLIGSQKLEWVPLGLADLLQRQANMLEKKYQNSKHWDVEKVGTLVEIVGDKKLMELLFYHLLENAWKYRDPSRFCQVRVSSTVKPDQIIVEIADNGCGFDPKYQEKILEPFRRLHKPSEIPGSGMGLAICVKIMQAHNGFITCEGKPNEGSLFRLCFPTQ